MQELISELEQKREFLDEIFPDVNRIHKNNYSLKKKIIESVSEINNDINSLNKEILEYYEKRKTPNENRFDFIKTISESLSLPTLNDITTFCFEFYSKIKMIERNKLKIDLELKKFEGIELEVNSIYKSKDIISEEIKGLIEDQLVLVEKKKELKDNIEQRNENFKLILQNYKDLKRSYDNIIEIFSKGKDEILKEIRFEAIIRFKDKYYTETVNDIFDKRKGEITDAISLGLLLQNIINENDEKFEEYLKSYIQNGLILQNGTYQKVSDSDINKK